MNAPERAGDIAKILLRPEPDETYIPDDWHGNGECVEYEPQTEPPVLVARRLSEVTIVEQPYLWPGRIPLGVPSMLAGRQGATKNLLVYDWIARVTTGSPWPDGAQGREPRDAVLLEAEESLDSSVAPRLRAAGADLARVTAIEGTREPQSDRTQWLALDRDLRHVERLLDEAAGRVGLVVISPITSYLGEVEQNSNEQVRAGIIHPLKTLAERFGVAVLLLKHPNKVHTNADPLERVGGSAAWTEAMRAVVYVGIDPDAPDDEKNPVRSAFWCKYSLGPRPEPLSWRITLDGYGHPLVSYIYDAPTYSAAEMLAGRRGKGDAPTKAEKAADWLLGQLEHGPMVAGEVERLAASAGRQAGFSANAFERARRSLVQQGEVIRDRRPKLNPPEWWLFLPSRPPEWYTGSNGADVTPDAGQPTGAAGQGAVDA